MKKFVIVISTVELTDSQALRLDGALDVFSKGTYRDLFSKISLSELKEGRL